MIFSSVTKTINPGMDTLRHIVPLRNSTVIITGDEIEEDITDRLKICNLQTGTELSYANFELETRLAKVTIGGKLALAVSNLV